MAYTGSHDGVQETNTNNKRKRVSNQIFHRRKLFGLSYKTSMAEWFCLPKMSKSGILSASRERFFRCKACDNKVSVIAGTVFHSTNLRLTDWFWAIYRMAQDKKGFSAMQLMKEIDVAYPTAWSVLHKIRCAMEERDKQYHIKGRIELDDAYLGGKSKGKRGRGAEGKVPILVAVEKRQTRNGTKCFIS